jgi:hypothetical protein
MATVRYTTAQLAAVTLPQLQRIAIELGLVGLTHRSELTAAILTWQSGKELRTPREFSAGMLSGPAFEAWGQLLDFYDRKKSVAHHLSQLSPLTLEGVLAQLPKLPALPASPHSLRVAYLLMYDKIAVTVANGTRPVASASHGLAQYFHHKDRITRYLLGLNDATLFAVVDQLGSDLVLAQPYVQINGTRYDDRLAVVYYLVTLQVR